LVDLLTLGGQTPLLTIPDLGQELEYLIKFQNKTEVGLSDVVIKAGLVGRLFDFSELVTEGDFYSKINTIVWDASNTPQLKMLSAGEKGVVSFRIKLRDYFPIYKLTDKNFTLNVNASIESPTVPPSVSANRIFSSTSLETKVRGVIMIQTKVYFRDASSGIVNRGVWPPRVNKSTNYTVHFLITKGDGAIAILIDFLLTIYSSPSNLVFILARNCEKEFTGPTKFPSITIFDCLILLISQTLLF